MATLGAWSENTWWLVFSGALFLALVPFAIMGRRRAAAADRLRRRRLARFAHDHGLRYERRTDPRLVPAPLASSPASVSVIESVWGIWEGTPIRVFGVGIKDDQGRRFPISSAIAATAVDAELPKCQIAAEDDVFWTLETFGYRDVQFESEDFNSSFWIRSEDDRFAHDLVDARMMRWLLGNYDMMMERHVSFFTDREWLVARGWGPFDEALVERVIVGVTKFHAHVPRVVYELYRKPIPNERPR